MAAKPDFKKHSYNTVHIRGGKFFAVALVSGKIVDEVEFPTQEEAEEFCRKSQTYA